MSATLSKDPINLTNPKVPMCIYAVTAAKTAKLC